MRSQPRRLWLVVLLAVITAVAATTLTGLASAERDKTGQTSSLPAACHEQSVTFPEFRTFSNKVWNPGRWKRETPSAATIESQRHQLMCAAGPNHRAAMKSKWHSDKEQFYKHRSVMVWRVRVTPFAGGGHWWAIPYYVVVCESGGRYNDPSAPNGAYSLLAGPLQGVPTWETWRPSWASGYALPYQAPPKAQDMAAHKLYRAYGLSPWECA